MAYGARNGLGVLAKGLLGFKDVNRSTHHKIIKLLEDNEAKRKLIVIPRGTLKSSLAVVAYSIWVLLNDPNSRILLDSELYSNSKNFLREIKSHLESPMLVDLYGQFKTTTWNESEIIIKQRAKTYREASVSVGGIGVQKTGQHFSHIIMDDMNSPSNSNTQEGLEKVIAHYRYNLSILEPDGFIVLIGTRYAAADLIGHVMDNEEVELIPV